MANDERRDKRPEKRADDATGDGGAREERHGIPGKGFDAGTGYGGAGGSSAYSGESSYGGQAGYGGSTTRGAYGGGKFGRPDDPGGAFAGRGQNAAGSSGDVAGDADATGQSDGRDAADAANGENGENGGDPDATGGGR